MSLKPECKKCLLDTLKKEGMPPVIDKTFGSIWDTFAKTQPSVLNTSASGDTDVWGNLLRCLEKYGVSTPIATKVVNAMKKKFGESPSNTDIKTFMS